MDDTTIAAIVIAILIGMLALKHILKKRGDPLAPSKHE